MTEREKVSGSVEEAREKVCVREVTMELGGKR